MDNKKCQKNAEKYICKKCNFICSKKSNFEIHLRTAKHRRITMDNKKCQKNAEIFLCECGNFYKYSSGLSKHRKKCEIYKQTSYEEISSNEQDNAELIKTIIKENKDMVMEMCKYMQPNNTVNATNYFNIQMFLNEECKDAMNISDFIEYSPLNCSGAQ